MLLPSRYILLLVLLSRWLTKEPPLLVSAQAGDDEPLQSWLLDDDGRADSDIDLEFCDASVEETDVVVVGCGLAGLFAAAHLQRYGFGTVILEADPEKCGGRLRSKAIQFDMFPEFGQLTIEEAANFMYGRRKNPENQPIRQNPIDKLFEGYGLANVDYEDTLAVFKSDGTRVAQSRVNRFYNELYRLVDGCLSRDGSAWFNEYERTLNNPSFQVSPDRPIPDVLSECGWVSNTPVKEAISHFVFEQENGVEIDELGRFTFGTDAPYDFSNPAPYRSFFQNDQRGSSWLIDEFIDSHIEAGSLRLDTAVQKIRYTEGRNPKVVAKVSENGRYCSKRYRSKYVIATPAIKVMRERLNFDPPLNLLDNHPIDVSIMEKVFLKFSEAFWPPDKTFILIANEQENGESSYFINLNVFYPGSDMLLTFLNGDALAAIGGQVTRDSMTQLIAGLFFLPGWSNDIVWDYFATDWHSNPHFLGSWEYARIGYNYKDYFDSIVPSTSKLHIAGAAHCFRYYGLTWGAILSGMWNGKWVKWKLERNDDFSDPPYTPCNDSGGISESDWTRTYLNNPFFEPKIMFQ